MYDTYATNRTILYLQKKNLFTMWDTYATNNTILYLQYKTCNTYLQWDAYTTKSAILTVFLAEGQEYFNQVWS